MLLESVIKFFVWLFFSGKNKLKKNKKKGTILPMWCHKDAKKETNDNDDV
jgi:hypothetical protein